jgi:hypothetical protein
MNFGSARSTRVDRIALGELLESAALLGQDLAARVAYLSGQFPAAAERNMFLEYELLEQPIAAGFGLGFLPGILDYYIATDHWFLKSSAGCAIAIALSDDPFASDHATYLNLLSDTDPDWIEYDIAKTQVALTPFVFFRLPSRHRTICTPEQVRSLCEILPAGTANEQFALILMALIGFGPTKMYRVGVARQRGKAWWRAIITDLHVDQVVAVLSSQGGTDFRKPLEVARELYAGRADAPGACFALSIDIEDARISAIDVECPYLFRINDISVRKATLKAFLAQSVTAGAIHPRIATWLAEYCCKDVISNDSRRQLRVMVHHLKCRFLGSPHLRTKAYLHLDMTAHSPLPMEL